MLLYAVFMVGEKVVGCENCGLVLNLLKDGRPAAGVLNALHVLVWTLLYS
jgi:hypothetical protein